MTDVRKPAGEIGAAFAWADGVCAAAIERVAELTDFEADFVSVLADRLGKYGAGTRVSDRQHAVIEAIERKLEGA